MDIIRIFACRRQSAWRQFAAKPEINAIAIDNPKRVGDITRIQRKDTAASDLSISRASILAKFASNRVNTNIILFAINRHCHAAARIACKQSSNLHNSRKIIHLDSRLSFGGRWY